MTSPIPTDTLITTDPRRRGGRPCVRDLDITVEDVLDWLALGASSDEIIADYPQLTTDDVNACVAHAAAAKPPKARHLKRP